MNNHYNETQQAVGAPIENWTGRPEIPKTSMAGKYCRLELLDSDKHADDLFNAFAKDTEGRNWTYLPYGPFESVEAFKYWLNKSCCGEDPLFFTIQDLSSGRSIGIASYLRIQPANGVAEVGHLHFSPLLQNTPMATEAMYLMMERVFDELGYRRYEWKCDSLNEKSCNAASRLGFTFEGIFRQAIVYKNRNRDTAWFSIIDSEWPALKLAFNNWLSNDNFNSHGNQKKSLSEFRK